MTRSRDTANTQENVGGAVAPFVAGKNKIINGDFNIWQRGVGPFSTVTNYTADRWNVDNSTTTRQTGTAQFPYCIQLASSTGNPVIRQGIELPAAGSAGIWQIGSTFTVSFYAKTSTSVSANLAFYAAFADGASTGLDTNAQQIVSTTNIGASSTSWTKYTTTFTIGSGVSPVGTNKCVEVVIYLNSGSYSGNFSITGVQLEAGSVATPFTTASGTLQGELALCQRYYYRLQTGTGYQLGLGSAINTNVVETTVYFPATMRTAPSLDQATGSNYYAWNLAGSTQTFNSFTADSMTTTLASIYATPTATKFNFAPFATNNASAYVGFSAEL
jgi:hypothetical protein